MFDRLHLNNLLAILVLLGLAGCSLKTPGASPTLPFPPLALTQTSTSAAPVFTSVPTLSPTPVPSRLLTICLGKEPESLFYYDASSTAAQDVLAAIYDGPVDIRSYTAAPVILQKIPSLVDGSATVKPVDISSGDLMVDSTGDAVNLAAGVTYRPSGCTQTSCAQTYAGTDPVKMDQLVLDFGLLPGIQWSDGITVTAADSVYSYELARSLTPSAQSALVSRTASYTALNDLTVEWVGVPGYLGGATQDKFFTPLPQHTWSGMTAQDLRTADIASRKPLGWGPYIIDGWVSGDHISLHKNPLYFRAKEGLPHFDSLVYRFVSTGSEALAALQAGECDLVDRTALLESQSPQLEELQNEGKLRLVLQADAGWEQLTFGITPLNSQRPQYFASAEVRQAVALCIDRAGLVSGQPAELQLLMDSYIPSTHPLYNPQVHTYAYDPIKAAALLDAAGWLDADNDPTTPRVAQGVKGVPDGTAFEAQYLVSTDAREQADAKAIQASLSECGIQVTVNAQDVQKFLAPGPEGAVFGRAFDLAQFAWTSALEPPCRLYLTSEIPGPYPDYPKGWGGANASGYSNPEYDQACQDALYSLPDSPPHKEMHLQAQEIFSADLPALPLYTHFSAFASRPDMCPIDSASTLDSPLWSLEQFDYGSLCTE